MEERIYTIPLRREFVKAPRRDRTNTALKTIRAFLKRHTKAENIKLGKKLSSHIWSHGIQHPPSKVRIKVRMKDDVVQAELVDVDFEEVKPKEEKKEEAKQTEEKKTEKKEEKPKEEKVEKKVEKNEDKKEKK
jgi:large subunit ribosomal protein L31e